MLKPRIALPFVHLFLVSIAFGGPYSAIEKEIRPESTDRSLLKLIRSKPSAHGSADLIKQLEIAQRNPKRSATLTEDVEQRIRLRAIAEQSTDRPPSDAHSDSNFNSNENSKGEHQAGSPDISEQPAQIAASIKRTSTYLPEDEREHSSWYGEAMKRLNMFHMPQLSSPASGKGLPWLGLLIQILLWGLLGIAVIVFACFALRQIRWSGQRVRAGLQEENEPELTLDEWLAEADRLEAEGRFREAVRCLYVACLLRIDEARIARFERGQTNWEHLRRIESSKSRPQNLDLRPATKSFDRIWYGNMIRGREDLDEFRAWYHQVLGAITVSSP